MALTAQSIVYGWKAIGEVFGGSGGIARRWADEGAPVVMVKPDLPCIAIPELWEWLSVHYGRIPGSSSQSMPGKTEELRGKASPEAKEQPSDSALPEKSSQENEKGEESARPDRSLHTAPETCSICGTTGMFRFYRGGWRCEWCHSMNKLDD